MKRCAKCGDTKPVDEFSKDSGHRDGLTSYCKLCAVAASTKWVAANPERAKAVKAKWNADNSEKTRLRHAANYAANSEEIKASVAKYRVSNPKKIIIRNHNQRARKREVGGTLTKGLVERLFKLQRGKCACCGLSLGDNYHLDHIMPLALGGSNVDSNIQLLRQKCNNQKHAKHPIDFMQSRGFLL